MFDAIAAATNANPTELYSALALFVTALASALAVVADKRYMGRFLAAYELRSNAMARAALAFDRYVDLQEDGPGPDPDLEPLAAAMMHYGKELLSQAADDLEQWGDVVEFPQKTQSPDAPLTPQTVYAPQLEKIPFTA